MERKHGKKKRYVKLHFTVDTRTKEVVAMEDSTDDMHDIKAFPGLRKKAEGKRRIARWRGDGAYDSGEVFEALEKRGIEAVIKPRRNGVSSSRSAARRRTVRAFQELGYESWDREKKGYARTGGGLIALTMDL